MAAAKKTVKKVAKKPAKKTVAKKTVKKATAKKVAKKTAKPKQAKVICISHKDICRAPAGALQISPTKRMQMESAQLHW